MINTLKILLLEDTLADAELIDYELKKSILRYTSQRVQTKEAFIEALNNYQPDLILSDFNLPQFTGIDALEIAKSHCINTPFILVTGNLDEETAVSCIKLGAWDYILKDRLIRLVPAITNALKLKEEIIEKNKVLNDLKASEAKFQDLYDNAPDMFLSIDPYSTLVINCNNTLLNELGYARNEFVGKSIFNFYTRETADYARGILFPEFIKTGLIKGAELQVIKKDGSIIDVWLTNSAVYGANGKIAYSRSIWRDITERKRMEKELKEERELLSKRVDERTSDLSRLNAELAQAVRMKDEFLANMSHELRTPLNAILGLSEVLLEEVYGVMNPNQLKSLKAIEDSGRHLLALINDILDIAKVDAGKMELEMSEVVIMDLCHTSINFIKQAALKKNISYSLKFDNVTETIVADERRLKQILINLLSNAVKFTPEGGTIGLVVSEDSLVQSMNFTIWDKGIGIKQESIPKLFKPFVQIDSSLSRQYAGTGLGLTLVKNLTEMHGGCVTLESAPGQGSSFNISLPVKHFTPKHEHEAGVQNSILENTKLKNLHLEVPKVVSNIKPLILIVEDNETNIQMLVDYLEIHDYKLIVARSGEEALLLAHHKIPDIILMDIQMPGMDGIETTIELRKSKDERIAKVPIIALTALAMPGDEKKCYDAGVNAYIKKPLQLSSLIIKIEEFFSMRTI